MKLLKQLVIATVVATNLLAVGMVRADTCYNPDEGQYYRCGYNDNTYVDPEAAGFLFGMAVGAASSYDNGGYDRGGWNNGRGGNGGHGGGHGGGGHHH